VSVGRLEGPGGLTIVEALRDGRLFSPYFEPRDSWGAWEVFLEAAFALPMTAEELALFEKHTGRSSAPAAPAREVVVVAGRRSGKSRIASLLAVWQAAFRKWRLSPGEVGTFLCIAVDKRQAATVLNYCRALFEAPMLRGLVVGESAEAIELRNRVRIEVRAGSHRGVRGVTLIGACLDEAAFLRSEESAAPDVELYRALVPATATVPGALIAMISSPYSRRGLLYEKFKRHWARDDGDTLVWKGTSRELNPTLPERLVEEALEADESAARAEWLAEFRSDLEAFVSREAVEACTVPGRLELPPTLDATYRAFCDPSGGSADSFTCAVAHGQGGVAVLDAVRERRPPFSPDAVVAEYAELLRSYGVHAVRADRYAGAWVVEAFAQAGIHCEQSADPKSVLYGNLLPLLNGARCELLDHPKLAAQLLSLERRTARGGRDSIDHGPGGHDDVANAACGALLLASAQAVGEPWGARLSPTPTRRVIDGETREPYWPSATGFDADPLHDRDYDDLRAEFRRNGW